MAGLRQRTLLNGNELFTEFKGALTEQYVCQQLKTIDNLGIYYYTNDRGSCEIDFVIDTGEQTIPVEVKAERNLKAKSLKTYHEKFNPECSVRASMADYKKEDFFLLKNQVLHFQHINAIVVEVHPSIRQTHVFQIDSAGFYLNLIFLYAERLIYLKNMPVWANSGIRLRFYLNLLFLCRTPRLFEAGLDLIQEFGWILPELNFSIPNASSI